MTSSKANITIVKKREKERMYERKGEGERERERERRVVIESKVPFAEHQGGVMVRRIAQQFSDR
jgi:hypothetical protein